MNGRIAIVSGAVFAGIVGAGIVSGGLSGAARVVGIGSDSASNSGTSQVVDAGVLLPLPADQTVSFDQAAPSSERESGEHSGEKRDSHSKDHEDDDD